MGLLDHYIQAMATLKEYCTDQHVIGRRLSTSIQCLIGFTVLNWQQIDSIPLVTQDELHIKNDSDIKDHFHYTVKNTGITSLMNKKN